MLHENNLDAACIYVHTITYFDMYSDRSDRHVRTWFAACAGVIAQCCAYALLVLLLKVFNDNKHTLTQNGRMNVKKENN